MYKILTSIKSNHGYMVKLQSVYWENEDKIK